MPKTFRAAATGFTPDSSKSIHWSLVLTKVPSTYKQLRPTLRHTLLQISLQGGVPVQLWVVRYEAHLGSTPGSGVGVGAAGAASILTFKKLKRINEQVIKIKNFVRKFLSINLL